MNDPANNKLILTAAWVAPMSRPVIREGAVFFRDGKIAAVGTVKSLKDEMRDATVIDAGNAVILPGLVNAHTHLELTNLKRGPKPARFVDWIIELMKTPVPSGGVEAGIQQCLKFGVTAVGDITSQPAASRSILSNSPLRGVSYGEVRAMALRRHFLEPRVAAAGEPIGSIRSGISPHAPYSIESAGYSRCLQVAREMALKLSEDQNVGWAMPTSSALVGVAHPTSGALRTACFPLATHLAETAAEADFLANHSGPFKELWDLLGAWDDQVPRFTGGPIRFAKSLGLLDYPTLLAHVNYCDDDEMELLANGRASVVYCPRTHAYFGHPPHRWREMLARGINVAVGTDSCASSPDLNLVDDLRLLHQIAPEVDSAELWKMATTRAAKAICCANVGSLEPGNVADAVMFPVKGDDPLRELLERDATPSSVWIGSSEHAHA